MTSDLEALFSKYDTLPTDELLNIGNHFQQASLEHLVWCNELIKRGVKQFSINSLAEIVSSLPLKWLKQALWDEANWSRIIVELIYQEAERRNLSLPVWYMLIDGVQHGPLNRKELQTLIKSTQSPDCMVWREGYPNWMPLNNWPNLYDDIEQVPLESPQDCLSGNKSNNVNASVMPLITGIIQIVEWPMWIVLFIYALFTSYNSFTGLLLPLVFCVFMIFMSIPIGVGLMARRSWAWNLKVVTVSLTILWFLNIFLIDGKSHYWIVATFVEMIILTFVILAKPSISEYA